MLTGNEAVESQAGESQSTETTQEDLGYGISSDLLKSLGIESGGQKKYSDDGNADISKTDETETEEGAEASDGESSSGQAKAPQQEEFELTVNGQVEKLTKDKVMEYAQKGYDYTKKTMELSDLRRTFEKERTDWETSRMEAQKALEQGRNELSELLNVKQVWDFYLDNLEKSNPDLHYQIMEGFNGVNSQFNNPIMKMQMDQLNKQMEQFKSLSAEQENAQIRNQFEKEFGELGERYKGDLEKLGIKINRDKVLNAWQKLEHAEKNSVNDAFILLYGDELLKALRSKAVLNDTKKKVEAKKTAPTVGKVSGSRETTSLPDFKKMSYDQLARAITLGELR